MTPVNRSVKELLDEAVAWGAGEKSMRNHYPGQVPDNHYHVEQRDAAIAQADAAIATGFLAAAQAQYMRDQLEQDGML